MIFGSQTLDTVIGLVLIVLFLSILCTAINELIVRVLSLRARHLNIGLRNLLEGANNNQFFNDFLQHPFILDLRQNFDGILRTTKLTPFWGGREPSEIPANVFSATIFDLLGRMANAPKIQDLTNSLPAFLKTNLANVDKLKVDQENRRNRDIEQLKINAIHGTEVSVLLNSIKAVVAHLPVTTRQPYTQLLETAGNDLIAFDIGLSKLPSHLQETTNWLKQVITVAQDSPYSKDKGMLSWPDLRSQVLYITNDSLRPILLSLFDQSNGDMKQTRSNIEDWFNHTMREVSYWYKRSLQLISLGVAFGVALSLNADLIEMGQILYTQPAIRTAMVEAANRYVEAQQQASASTGPATPSNNSSAAKLKVDQALHDIQTLPMPIGWRAEHWALSKKPTQLFWKLLGILMATVAMSLGAPFWFDILQRLSSFRASRTSQNDAAVN